MQRRSKLEGDAFNELVEQNLEPDMATNIKTIFEVAEEKAELRGRIEGKLEGEQIGEQKGIIEGELKKARIGVINMLNLGIFSIEQIADVLDVSLDFVKNIQAESAENPNLKA